MDKIKDTSGMRNLLASLRLEGLTNLQIIILIGIVVVGIVCLVGIVKLVRTGLHLVFFAGLFAILFTSGALTISMDTSKISDMLSDRLSIELPAWCLEIPNKIQEIPERVQEIPERVQEIQEGMNADVEE